VARLTGARRMTFCPREGRSPTAPPPHLIRRSVLSSRRPGCEYTTLYSALLKFCASILTISALHQKRLKSKEKSVLIFHEKN
jgi:hypothetical protein